MAQPLAYIQHNLLHFFGGIALTLKTGEVWLEYGAPLPGYGPLRVSAHPHEEPFPDAPATPSFPSPPVSDVDKTEYHKLLSSQGPHFSARNRAQLSGLRQQHFHVTNQTLTTAFETYNATNTIGGITTSSLHVGNFLGIAAGMGAAAFAIAFLKFSKARTDK